MSVIKVLPDQLINKIAAGEVVERPAAVVKELVENALDAQATRIEVDLEDGGKKSIRVHDNGVGIHPDELRLAISRHATSKIAEVDDLDNIGSFGFRGEALASIASVSKLSLKSKRRDLAASARQIIVEGGNIIDESETSHPEGTTVQIKYLFYNTPARLKFLKTSETEISHVLDYLTNAALANPHVAFRVNHNGNKVLFTEGRNNLTELVALLFDKDLASNCFTVSKVQGDLMVSGLVANPEVNRSQSRDIHLFVNGRPVKDKMLIHAAVEAYRDLLMRGRYPFVVLFINLPGTMVDVNVHPAKTEVRFLNSQIIHRLVIETIREKLITSPWIQKPAPAQMQAETDCREPKFNLSLSQNSSPPAIINNNDVISHLKAQIDETAVVPPVKGYQTSGRKIPYRDLKIIGQFLATYIVCEGVDKMVLIDQHAAHERIGFEKLLLKYEQGGIPAQELLVPHNFDLKPSETEILKQLVGDLKPLGYDIEHFGGHTFVVRSEPVLLMGKVNVRDLMVDLIGDAIEKGCLTSIFDHLHHVLATMACHAAIRANHRLDISEMQALLNELDEYQLTSFCPHGRPAAVEVDKYEMERWFKRIV
ncbi:MAG: hypothetical protein ACD_73C00773G0006 [uncultured bacterium]|nr:MAG: hypothetical protein ACD_73C00773G0006 [uncultured bacterium]